MRILQALIVFFVLVSGAVANEWHEKSLELQNIADKMMIGMLEETKNNLAMSAETDSRMIHAKKICPKAIMVLAKIGTGGIPMDEAGRHMAAALVGDRAGFVEKSLVSGSTRMRANPIKETVSFELAEGLSHKDLMVAADMGVDFLIDSIEAR